MSSTPGPPGDPRRFDLPVRPGGYAWWYVDALSDDGAHALTLIVFVGSVFSPHYARARRREGPDAAEPERFCAVNLALYALGDGRGPRAWALTEHAAVARERDRLEVGRSAIAWRDDRLEIDLDERATLFFGREGPPLRGRVRLQPTAMFGPRIELDAWRERPRHRWYPVAPHGRIEVELEHPNLAFSGSGYHDVNEGDEPLEHGFSAWNWSRCELGDHTRIVYDVVAPDGSAHPRAWSFDAARSQITDLPARALGPASALPAGGWGVARAIRSAPGHPPKLIRTLEDSPFYTRSLVEVTIDGRTSTAIHESIALQRFASAWVRFLLRFKIRRSR